MIQDRFSFHFPTYLSNTHNNALFKGLAMIAEFKMW